jgi:hypothetical protein
MGFEVWALGVDFGASGEITVMNPSFLQFGVVASIVFDCLKAADEDQINK